MNRPIEETPPPPSLSEAPPSYTSLDPHPSHPHSSLSHPPQFCNPSFPEGDVIEQALRHGDYHGDQGFLDEITDPPDPPPPYSPGPMNTRDTTNVYDAPPSYYSLFGQIREAREQTSNNFDFLRRVGQIVLNTVGCTILLAVFMSVPIAVLVLGAIYVPRCPLEPNIPIYLIIAGLAGILKNIFLIIENIVKRYSHTLSSRVKHSKYYVYAWRAVNLIFNLFMLAWIIAGSYWVYHVYREVNKTDYESCNELLYKFAFGIVTSSYILLVLICCCTCCCAGVCLRRNKNRNSSSSDRESGESGSDDDDSDNESQTRGAEDGEGESGHELDDGLSIVSQSDRDHTATTGDTLDATDTDLNVVDTNALRVRNTRVNGGAVDTNTNAPLRLNNGAIMQFDSSPYPSRHHIHMLAGHIPSHLERDSDNIVISEYANSPVLSPTRPHHQTHSHSNTAVGSHSLGGSVPVAETEAESFGASNRSRTSELYITESSEGFSVTTV